MPRALPLPRREQIVLLHQQGRPLAQVARALHLPERTVRRIWQRYQQEGDAGLAPRYDRCARRGIRFAAALYDTALAWKRAHARWGARLIRLRLAEQFPHTPLPKERTLQTWFRAAGLQRGRAHRPPMQRGRAQAVHEVWEVDAKERMRLADGSGTSVLTVTEELSGALLGAALFPPVSLEAGSGDGGAGGIAPSVRTMGPTPADPGGQWDALGHLGRLAGRHGAVVDWLGDRSHLQPPRPTHGEPQSGAV